ncbi:hypothetical protein A9Q84_15390 [Halobacteriovorax marinus]|uniref:Uncharacterized protein n=1 Tax=Halobacteriovorax marinus TaxID=97084 RepID=A0A1Y5F432_9BACT|nr:hypothetical protein A9Q84_15390 [Halobacteriovorax marinus]
MLSIQNTIADLVLITTTYRFNEIFMKLFLLSFTLIFLNNTTMGFSIEHPMYRKVSGFGELHIILEKPDSKIYFYDNDKLLGNPLGHLGYAEVVINNEVVCKGRALYRVKKLNRAYKIYQDLLKLKKNFSGDLSHLKKELFDDRRMHCTDRLYANPFDGGGPPTIFYTKRINENTFLSNFEGQDFYFKIEGVISREIEGQGWDYNIGKREDMLYTHVKLPNKQRYKYYAEKNPELAKFVEDLKVAIKKNDLKIIESMFGTYRTYIGFRKIMKPEFDRFKKSFVKYHGKVLPEHRTKFREENSYTSFYDFFEKKKNEVLELLELGPLVYTRYSYTSGTNHLSSISFFTLKGVKVSIFIRRKNGKKIVKLTSFAPFDYLDSGG